MSDSSKATGGMVSVVVPLYDGEGAIAACVSSLLRQEPGGDLEILVVDDGSTDDGAALVSRYPVRLLRQPNRGPAAARNAGARVARGEIVVFVDADTVVPTGWVSSMLRPFADPRVLAAVGAIESASDGMLPRLVQLEIEERYRRMARVEWVDFIASVAVAFRRQVFLDIGGFSEELRYNEDVEIAYRLNAARRRIAFVRQPRVAHRHPASLLVYAKTKFWRGVWRMRLYRHYPGKAIGDDWTPQSLKLQMVLGPLILALLAVGLFRPAALVAAIGLVALFLASAAGLYAEAWRRGDRDLIPVLAPFLWWRAMALCAAVGWYVVSALPRGRRGRSEGGRGVSRT